MHTPAATYRLQFTESFDLRRARGLVEYLHRLGVSTIYASPLLKASSEAEHGYSVVDPTRFDPSLYEPGDLRALAADLRERDMSLLLDIVPNHMAASVENPWWRDVLKRGPASRYAAFFDIDWNTGPPARRGRVVLPILGDSLEAVLRAGEVRVAPRESGEPVLELPGHALPIDPESWSALEVDPSDTTALEALNEPDPSGDRPRLRALIEEQNYIPMYWRDGLRALNYRRFFDIADLVCLRVEDDAVFGATHRLITQFVHEDVIDGVRIDHVDGLRDPSSYLQRLRHALDTPPPEASAPTSPSWILVEKILAEGESLPPEWPVQGATGYEFLVALDRAFTDPAGLRAIVDHARPILGDDADFHDLVFRSKSRALGDLFQTERRRVRSLFLRAHARSLPGTVPARAAARALEAITVALPVYRTYIDAAGPSADDRAQIRRAVEDAEKRGAADPVALTLLRDLLTARSEDPAHLELIARWQQLTGPLMAKGVEDTALYVHTAFVALNEVGGEPIVPNNPVRALHDFLAERQRTTPFALSASSTHDTKRSEDVRTRLLCLAQIPDEWNSRVDEWIPAARAFAESQSIDQNPIADADLLLLFQTLLAAWPLEESDLDAFPDRVADYLVKASREAKRRSSWLDPNDAFESAFTGLARALIDALRSRQPLPRFHDLRDRLARAGAMTSIAQAILRVAAPGVPDIYQGAETWLLTLVDPDNRSEVDFETRERLLRGLDAGAPPLDELIDSWPDGRLKLHALSRALRARRDRAEFFARAEYRPLEVEGDDSTNPGVIAFQRTLEGACAVALARRTLLSDPPVDMRLRLPQGAPPRFHDVLTQQTIEAPNGAIRCDSLLRRLPAALLVSSD